MNMTEVRCGQWLRVIGFMQGSYVYRQRLLAMGLVPGARFFVEQLAPLGDPINISVLGASWMLRRKEAACVEVVVD